MSGSLHNRSVYAHGRRDGPDAADTMQDSPATAAQCRERARRYFELAIAEENIAAREAYLRQGEDWMLRWRHWTPEAVEAKG